MPVKSLIDEGKLREAIDAQIAEVKAKPSDLAGRTRLFELLAYEAEWDRAGRQLDAITGLLADDPAAMVGAAVYRRLVDAEKERAKLFSEGVRPRLVLEPPDEVNLHLEALNLLRKGETEAARERLAHAALIRSTRPGALGEERFDDFRDADDLLAPILEVFAPAGYCWIPWEQIQFVEVTPPRSFRDLLWAPAKLAMFDGQLGEVHLPAIYPGSTAHADTAAHLGRITDWSEAVAGIVRGVGLKTFLAGSEPRTLFELGNLSFEPPASEATT